MAEDRLIGRVARVLLLAILWPLPPAVRLVGSLWLRRARPEFGVIIRADFTLLKNPAPYEGRALDAFRAVSTSAPYALRWLRRRVQIVFIFPMERGRKLRAHFRARVLYLNSRWLWASSTDAVAAALVAVATRARVQHLVDCSGPGHDRLRRWQISLEKRELARYAGHPVAAGPGREHEPLMEPPPPSITDA